MSATIPEHVAEALDRFIKQDPTNPSRSRIISQAPVRYISSFYPELVRREAAKEPAVVAALKSARPHAPFPTLRTGQYEIGCEIFPLRGYIISREGRGILSHGLIEAMVPTRAIDLTDVAIVGRKVLNSLTLKLDGKRFEIH